MESRYGNRFRSLGEQSGKDIKNQDSAGNLTEHLTVAKASLTAQKQNISALFSTSQEMVVGINTYQQMMEVDMVKNIPLPTADVKASPSLQLGYVQLVMRFLQAGLLHFMEQTADANHRLEQKTKLVSKLAEYDQEIDILGELQILDLESLEQSHAAELLKQSVLTPPTSVKSDSSIDNRDKLQSASVTSVSSPKIKEASVKQSASKKVTKG